MKRALLALLAVATGLACGDAPHPHGGELAGWPTWGGDPGGTRFSRLAEITRANVEDLRVAWTFRTGDYDPSGELRTSFQATPVLHGETLYLCTPFNRVFALEAETGRQRWVFDPGIERTGRHFTCRGVALHEEEAAPSGAACRTRVLTGTVDLRLIALDAETGQPCADFGVNGEVDLRRGLGDVAPGEVKVYSTPTVIGDVVAVGTMVSDNKRADAPSGVVRGYDVRTGAQRWAFDPAPPGSEPLPPGPDGPQYQRGTPNAWGVFSADPARDLLFVPTGNPSNDFYRGGRGAIDHYGSSVVALRGSTGELVWSFQTVRHDLWDYDVGSQPSAIEVPRGGRRVAAVAQPTKMGHVFLLDRESGAPLFPIEERRAPASDVPGEESAASQPIPTHPRPLHPERVSEADLFSFTPLDAADCRERLAALRNDGPFTPPSLRGSLEFPGVAGGVNWGSAAWEPDRNLLVLTQTRLATVHRLIPRAEVASTPANPPFEILFPQLGAPYALLQSVFVSSWGIPCTKPPWSELLAIDLASGEIAWRVPFGSTRGQAPWPFWFDWGTPGMGGPIATAGGLVFIGASMDGFLRAFDVETGEELWRHALPAGGQANPMTYRATQQGPQFVVIAAGGHATLGTELGDWVVAYALP
ncbi:MAG: pyrroloquinoline quinone-dependent dehydrogenase [Myxococcota bacterium]